MKIETRTLADPMPKLRVRPWRNPRVRLILDSVWVFNS